MATQLSSEGIFAPENAEKREHVVELLAKAYWMEVETVMSYIAGSVNPDGVRAQEIRESLEEDIQEELGHAKQFAERIKELWGVVPGSEEFAAEQSFLRERRPGHPGHGDRHPPRRAGPSPPVRGLPSRVRGRGPHLEAQTRSPGQPDEQ
jgi:hypothetical protein